jgi:hypothetical protein
MHEIGKYYVFSGAKQLFLKRSKISWMCFFRVGSFVRVVFYSDGYINLKFSGICAKKVVSGVGSTFTLSDRSGLRYKYFFFMPTILRLKVIRF